MSLGGGQKQVNRWLFGWLRCAMLDLAIDAVIYLVVVAVVALAFGFYFAERYA